MKDTERLTKVCGTWQIYLISKGMFGVLVVVWNAVTKQRKFYKYITDFRGIRLNMMLQSSSDNISTSHQHCLSIAEVQHCWNNVYPALKMNRNPTSDFQCCTTLIQRRCPTLEQRFPTEMSQIFNAAWRRVKTFLMLIWQYHNFVSTWPQLYLKFNFTRNQSG